MTAGLCRKKEQFCFQPREWGHLSVKTPHRPSDFSALQLADRLANAVLGERFYSLAFDIWEHMFAFCQKVGN